MFTQNAVLALLLSAALPVLAAPAYTVTALPYNTHPAAINSAGQIVGELVTVDGLRGFLWDGGMLTQLGTLGGSYSSAVAINALGHITGYAGTAFNDVRAVTYSNGAATDLNILGGTASSFGMGINGAGQIAGQYFSGGYQRSFGRSGGIDTDLGTLGGNNTYARAINGAGHIVGESAVVPDSLDHSHAFIYIDGKMSDLGTLGGNYSVATAINDQGQVAGMSHLSGFNGHAFRYANGVMIDLGTLGGQRSFAFGINGSGLVVGTSDAVGDTNSFAFLSDGTLMTNLNSLIDPALGWILHSATAINDTGQIAAYGCRANDCMGVMLAPSPVPEPETWTMLLAGLALVARRARTGVSAACRRA